MTCEQARAIVSCVYEKVLNEGDFHLVREVIAEEAVDHAPRSRSSLPVGRGDAIKDFLDELCTAFPDCYWTVEQIQMDGDTVVVRTMLSGNHHAEFRGLAATGGCFAIAGLDTVRISESKIVEHWGELDMASLTEQLSVPFPTADEEDASWNQTSSTMPVVRSAAQS